MINLETFIKIVRPLRVVDFDLNEVIETTEDPVLLYGGDLETFERVLPLVGWGSAIVLLGMPTASENIVDHAETVALKHSFHHWFRGKDMPGFPDHARSWVKHQMTGDTFSTHKEVLKEAVQHTTGPVLELGAGRSSTPLLHEVCSGRLLVTVDRDVEWLMQFSELATDMHKFEHNLDPAKTKWLDDEWSVVFVDHAPGETRGKAVERAREHAEYILVHDSEDLGYGIEDLLQTFKYRKDFRRVRPWTTVVSEMRPAWDS